MFLVAYHHASSHAIVAQEFLPCYKTKRVKCVDRFYFVLENSVGDYLADNPKDGNTSSVYQAKLFKSEASALAYITGINFQ